MDEPTPILRADATDDDPEEIWIPDIDPAKAEEAFHSVVKIDPERAGKIREAIADSEAPVAGEPAIVEAEPAKRLVPVVVNGVFHGMREE